MTKHSNNQQQEKEKVICQIMDFAVQTDHRVKLKVSEKKDKYLDLARELKKLWNMKVMAIRIVIGALGAVPKGLIRGQESLEIRRQDETIQTTASLRSAIIQRSVQETWGDLV